MVIVLFLVSVFFVPCDGLSWLPVSFLLHCKYILSYRIYKLRSVDKFKGIVISHDMTKSERDQCKQLIAEAKTRESQDESGEFIFRVKKPP